MDLKVGFNTVSSSCGLYIICPPILFKENNVMNLRQSIDHI